MLGKMPSIFVKKGRKGDIKQICQNFKDSGKDIPRFASVFDLKHKIPLYSAYKIKTEKDWYLPKKDKKEASEIWKYEPQLEDASYPISMMMIGDLNKVVNGKKPIQKKDIVNQPTDEDYESSRWEKGHLFPRAYNVMISVFF